MRCLPTALATRDPANRIRESMEISAVTHDDPRCTIACAVYNEIVVALLDGTQAALAVEVGVATARRLGSDVVAEAIRVGAALSPAVLADTGPAGLAGLGGDAGGYVLDSLSLAVAAVLDPRPLVDVLVDVVRIGKDTDTNAAIAGGLLGARDGVAAIPTTWLSRLQFAEEFTDAARRLAGPS